MISATGYRRLRVGAAGGGPAAPRAPRARPAPPAALPRRDDGADAVDDLRHRLPAAQDGAVRGVLDGPARLGELVPHAVRGGPILLPPGQLPAGGQGQDFFARLLRVPDAPAADFGRQLPREVAAEAGAALRSRPR